MAPLLHPAGEADRPIVERLVQLYLYDMASEHPWPLQPDGRYAYELLDRFWQHPYLIYADGDLAGFALVIRGCPITGREDCWFMAEFFVLRPYWRQGLGSRAALAALARHSGSWHVAVMQSNRPAVEFWSRSLAGFAPAVQATRHEGDAWLVHVFESDRAAQRPRSDFGSV